MLKLLRKTRRKMLNNGEVSKYLKYAIGEIALVVIGILIALSINNCNTNKANRNTELQLYKNIKTQINEDRAVVNGVMDYNNVYQEQYKHAIEIIKNDDRSQIDTLSKISFNQFRYSDYNRSSNIYQSLVNSGQLKFLKNSRVIERLQQLEENYIYINRMEEIHFKIILKFVGPGVMDNINLATGEVARPEELYSFGMQNIYISFLEVMDEKNDIYKRAIAEIDSINELIEEELNN